MSVKIEYICDNCGITGPVSKGWIEFNLTINGSDFFRLHSCINVECVKNVQKNQIRYISDWSNKQKMTVDPDIDKEQWWQWLNTMV